MNLSARAIVETINDYMFNQTNSDQIGIGKCLMINDLP
jgi:hypothetical protein